MVLVFSAFLAKGFGQTLAEARFFLQSFSRLLAKCRILDSMRPNHWIGSWDMVAVSGPDFNWTFLSRFSASHVYVLVQVMFMLEKEIVVSAEVNF